MDVTDLQQFARDLAQLIGRPSLLRPFVCDGSPLTCTAFIIGSNPKTDVGADFWKHWHDDRGFDKRGWYRDYLQARAREKTRVSTTRKRIELAVNAAAPVRILETNLFAKDSPTVADLAAQDRSVTTIQFLLERIAPRVVLAHGEPAKRFMRGVKAQALVIESPHFAARGIRDSEAARLGGEIARACASR